MSARVPDFATLSEAAYEAAEDMIAHLEACDDPRVCPIIGNLREDYRTKKDKALKALRRKK